MTSILDTKKDSRKLMSDIYLAGVEALFEEIWFKDTEKIYIFEKVTHRVKKT